MVRRSVILAGLILAAEPVKARFSEADGKDLCGAFFVTVSRKRERRLSAEPGH